MQYKYWLNTALGTLLAITGLSALALAMPSTPARQAEVPVPAVDSIELHDGARVILRYGPMQRVTMIKGRLDYTSVTVADGGRLIINKCKSRCPRGYELEIEIVTSDIASISVNDGGTIQSQGDFPRRAQSRRQSRRHDRYTLDVSGQRQGLSGAGRQYLHNTANRL